MSGAGGVVEVSVGGRCLSGVVVDVSAGGCRGSLARGPSWMSCLGGVVDVCAGDCRGCLWWGSSWMSRWASVVPLGLAVWQPCSKTGMFNTTGEMGGVDSGGVAVVDVQFKGCRGCLAR
jgi:hypothetical protein